MMTDANGLVQRWFGTFRIPMNGSGSWQVGPSILWVRRTENDWRLAVQQASEPSDETLSVDVPSDTLEPPEGAKIRRVGFSRSPDSVMLTPALADRPVVVSPEDHLELPAGEQITLRISTPAWIELAVGSPPVVLADEPTHRPTDTWFGPSPMKGELCYAVRTVAQIGTAEIQPRPNRVVSEVEIRNRSKNTLVVERLKIPMPHLSVYVARDSGMWTESLILDHHEDDAMAAVRLGKGPPDHVSGAILVRGPRAPMEAGLLTRAFGGLVL